MTDRLRAAIDKLVALDPYAANPSRRRDSLQDLLDSCEMDGHHEIVALATEAIRLRERLTVKWVALYDDKGAESGRMPYDPDAGVRMEMTGDCTLMKIKLLAADDTVVREIPINPAPQPKSFEESILGIRRPRT